MQNYYYPPYKPGYTLSGIYDFLTKNFPEFEFEKNKTSKGVEGYTVHYREGGQITLFGYQINGVSSLEFFWKEYLPSSRFVSLKMAVDTGDRWRNAFEFLCDAFPLLTNPNYDTELFSDDDLKRIFEEAISEHSISVISYKMSGETTVEEEFPEGDIEMEIRKPDPIELDRQINVALDKGDREEFERLSAMKESKQLKNLIGYEDFSKKLIRKRDI